MQGVIIKLLAIFILSMHSFIVQADIYEFIDEKGVAHFSDSPNDERYSLVLLTPNEPIPKADSSSIVKNNGYGSVDNNFIQTPPQLVAQIKQAAQNNQIESELIHAVMYVESAYKTKAKSHKGAQGLMQLMPQTAKRFGVRDSYDSAQNIEGGAKYLREFSKIQQFLKAI